MALGRKTGGRQKGTRNKRTLQHEAQMKAAAAQLSAAIPDAFEGDAHAFLMAIYKNPSVPLRERIDAAGKAIGYEKPKLSSVDSSGTEVKRYVARLPSKCASVDEWLALYGDKEPDH